MQCHVEHCLFDYHKHVSNTTQTSKRCAMLQRLKDCMNRKAEHCRRTDRRFAFIDEKRQESVKSYKCEELEAKKGLLWCHNRIIYDVRVSKLQFAPYDNSDFIFETSIRHELIQLWRLFLAKITFGLS